MRKWVLAGLTAWAIAVGTGQRAAAAVPTYSFVQVHDFGFNVPQNVNTKLGDGADVLVWTESFGFFELFSLRNRERHHIASRDSGAGELLNAGALGVAADGDALYIGYWDFADPRAQSLMLSNGTIDFLAIATQLAGQAGGLSQFASMNAGGDIAYARFTGAQSQLHFWSASTSATTPLATCTNMGKPALNPLGTMAFQCWTGINGSIFRGSSLPFETFVEPTSFTPSNIGRNDPIGITSAGVVGFNHTGGSTNGLYVKGAGVPVYLGAQGTCTIQAFNEQSLFLCDDGTSLGVRSEAVNPVSTHTVISVGSALAGGTVTSLYAQSSHMNALGQISFVADVERQGEFGLEVITGVFVGAPSFCDADADGYCAANDNCPAIANSGQNDIDGDGFGDVCDNCPINANADQTDANADGRGDACAPCTLTGPGVPICGTRSVGAGGETFNIAVPIGAFPSRPLLHGIVRSNTPGLVVDVSIPDPDPSDGKNNCTGGNIPPAAFGFESDPLADGDGRMRVRLYYAYPYAADRVGATCNVQITASGAAGSYRYTLETTTATPTKNPEDYSVTNTEVTFPVNLNAESNIVFIEEAQNHRFLYTGTGGANFGTCRFEPTPPFGDSFDVVYSAAAGPGWDCCTFQFDGVDGVPSAVGQIVMDLGGTPPVPDLDVDGFLNPCDSCDYIANDQFDRGRVGPGLADGIGDACQCTELTNDGIVNASDVTRLRQHLAQSSLLGATQLARCSGIGGQNECTVRTLAVLRRALVPLGPGVAQSCDAALP